LLISLLGVFEAKFFRNPFVVHFSKGRDMQDIFPSDARMQADMVVAGLAEQTQEPYLRAVRQLSRFYDGACPSELTEQQVK